MEVVTESSPIFFHKAFFQLPSKKSDFRIVVFPVGITVSEDFESILRFHVS